MENKYYQYGNDSGHFSEFVNSLVRRVFLVVFSVDTELWTLEEIQTKIPGFLLIVQFVVFFYSHYII